MHRQAVARRLIGAFLGLSFVLEAQAADVLEQIAFFEDGQRHPTLMDESDSTRIYRAWPFCPTDRMPCSESELVWAQMAISIDTYSAQRNDPHSSVAEIVAATQQDFRPLIKSLRRHFSSRGFSSDLARLAFVQGMVQAFTYSRDVDTGWTEYPKFGVEFLVDEQGDCDDAALTQTVLLEGLGYEAYIVNWDSRTVGDEGHLSTAVRSNRGDLVAFSLPPGSRWVEAPGAPRLLPVDATGTIGGCGVTGVVCSPVGFNEWHKLNLHVAAVARPSDTELEAKIPISAWRNGGQDRPSRKVVPRRTATDDEVRQEVLNPGRRHKRLEERLRNLGFDPKGILVVHENPIPAWQFYSTLTFCIGLLLAFAVTALRRRRARLARVAELRGVRWQRGL